MNLRMPWTREADPPADDPLLYEDPPEPEGEPEPDPLEEFDADQRAAVEAYVEQERQRAIAEMRAPLQQAGLDVADGKLVGDPQRFAQWMQPGPQQPQTPQHPAAPAAPEEEAWPDPTYNPAEFRARMRAEVQREAQEMLKTQSDQQAGAMQAFRAQIEDDAIGRVPEALKAHAPYLVGILNHPGFEEAFRSQLPQTDPAQWRNPRFLASMVGAIAPQLGPPPAGNQPRQTDGRFAPVAQNQQRSRVPLGQLGASVGGRGPAPTNYTEQERLTAQRLGKTPEEVRAAEDPEGHALREVWARQRAQGRGAGRR